MAVAKSKIEWTDSTWSPVRGCSRVSEGCRHCYAEGVAKRFSGTGMPYEGLIARGGQWNGSIKLVPEQLEQPLRWRRPRRIFVNSMSDLFHEGVPDAYIDQVFAVMALCPQHTFQVLTKRPERMLRYCMTDDSTNLEYEPDLDGEAARDAFIEGQAQRIYAQRHAGEDPSHWLAVHQPLPNVWLGVSVENQATADERIPLLMQTPAAVRWISAEPLLGAIDLERIEWPGKGGHRVDVLRGGYWNAEGWRAFGPSAALGAPKGGFTNHSDIKDAVINWVVAGGESGPRARAAHPEWFASLRDQCRGAGTAFLFKQWGEWVPSGQLRTLTPEEHRSFFGRDERYVRLDGTTHSIDDLEQFSASDELMISVGKKRAGRVLDGRIHDEYPRAAA